MAQRKLQVKKQLCGVSSNRRPANRSSSVPPPRCSIDGNRGRECDRAAPPARNAGKKRTIGDISDSSSNMKEGDAVPVYLPIILKVPRNWSWEIAEANLVSSHVKELMFI
jgi:hypothetical protein